MIPPFLHIELLAFEEVLEVERLELDHFWEIHRQQLEQRDQERTLCHTLIGAGMISEIWIHY